MENLIDAIIPYLRYMSAERLGLALVILSAASFARAFHLLGSSRQSAR